MMVFLKTETYVGAFLTILKKPYIGVFFNLHLVGSEILCAFVRFSYHILLFNARLWMI
jgi:hypothetical protein